MQNIENQKQKVKEVVPGVVLFNHKGLEGKTRRLQIAHYHSSIFVSFVHPLIPLWLNPIFLPSSYCKDTIAGDGFCQYFSDLAEGCLLPAKQK